MISLDVLENIYFLSNEIVVYQQSLASTGSVLKLEGSYMYPGGKLHSKSWIITSRCESYDIPIETDLALEFRILSRCPQLEDRKSTRLNSSH